MSNRAEEYRGLIEDVCAGGLLEDDEWFELRDMLARIERKLLAEQPVDQPSREVVNG